jgi:glycosyltransferase involved in cell wall biosynthesis
MHPTPGTPRVAIVHDWLVNPGGAELVLRDLLRVFPEARVFTLIDHLSADDRRAIGLGATTTSSLQNIPGIARHYRNFLPLMPLALRSLDVSGFDIVISNSHAIAKGITTTDAQLHICYCLSPMRYAWDLREPYLRASGLGRGIKGALARTMLERMRRWDAGNTHGVDAFVTLSQFIAERIERAYGRASTVIYPPVDTDYFTPEGPREDFYLTASRFVQYKRIDLIAEAFRLLPDRRLIIVGDGPDAAKIRAAAGPNVTLVGRQSRSALRDYLRRARAFIFAAEEDFGIAPVEAQACGTPVIAYGAGGALETVRAAPFPTPTGLFFEEQSAEAIADAVRRFEALTPTITSENCRTNAERFDGAIFRDQMRRFVDETAARRS